MDSLDSKELKRNVKELDKAVQESSQGEIEQLRNQIVAEIRKESFKKEILAELEVTSRRDSLWKTAQHPAVLLIIGFALTTGLGSFLTYKWQNRTNERQAERQTQQQNYDQKQSSRQRAIQQKYELTDQVVKAVAETNTAAEDILVAFDWDSNRRRAYPERVKYWQESSRKWRVESRILTQKLIFRFIDPKIAVSFQEILEKRKDVGVTIEYIQGIIGEKGWTRMQNDIEATKELKRSQKLINEIKEDLGKLMGKMMAEIKTDETPSSV